MAEKLESVLTEDFIDCFGNLPKQVKKQARKAYRLWKNNHQHPGLEFKIVYAKKKVYSVRISLGWRALGLRHNDIIICFWIGSHTEYEKRLSQLE